MPADGAKRRRVLVASNRGPVSFSRDEDGELTAKRGGGGVVSGLSSVASSEDMLWVCAALSDADRAAAREAPGGLLDLDGHRGGSAVQMLDIAPGTFNRAYNTVANSVLWFVHHMLYDTPNRPQFGFAFERDWAAYREYNQAFAQALAADAGSDESRAVIQDYHLTLAPQDAQRAATGSQDRALLAHPVGAGRLLPAAARRRRSRGPRRHPRRRPRGLPLPALGQRVHGLLRADPRCPRRPRRGQVSYEGHVTGIGIHPLGVDAQELIDRAAQPDVELAMASLTEMIGDRKLIVRVDRTELSKNIVRGLAAFRELLLTRPEWRGKVMMLSLAYPSRSDLPEYREYTAAVQRLASAIDDEFGSPDWTPVLLQTNDDYPRSLAGYRLADVLLVNPIRDGMNLVAKEGPILSDRNCALVLSREAGAAAELGADALMINPFDIAETATALHEALMMSEEERFARCRSLAAPPAPSHRLPGSPAS